MSPILTSALLAAAVALPDHTVHGVITALHGKYELVIRDDHADDARVTLHRGTIIQPTGLRLEPGMQVTISGHPDGATFDAVEVDAPAHYLEDQEFARRQAQGSAAPAAVSPDGVPNGTFQTNGPSATGGG
jgi:hypothetical protein